MTLIVREQQVQIIRLSITGSSIMLLELSEIPLLLHAEQYSTTRKSDSWIMKYSISSTSRECLKTIEEMSFGIILRFVERKKPDVFKIVCDPGNNWGIFTEV